MLNRLRTFFCCLVVKHRSPLGRYFGSRHTLLAPLSLFASPDFGSSFGLLPFAAILLFSFVRCLLSVCCRFLTDFCLASCRRVGVGCEAPQLLSISPSLPDGFCALLIFYASASTGLQGGLVSWYSLSPLLLRKRYSFEEEE